MKWVQIESPVVTKFHEGVAAPQGGLAGGGNQICFDQHVDPGWVVAHEEFQLWG